MHAEPDATYLWCRCGEIYHAELLRERLLDEAGDALLTGPELGTALTSLAGRTGAAGTIKSWKSRGQLAPYGAALGEVAHRRAPQ